MITSSSRCGISGFRRTAGTGARCRISLNAAAEVAPRNGNFPVAISYNTVPNENRSVRASSSFPNACSGDIYATVPRAEPGLVICSLESSNVASSDAVSPVAPTPLATFASPKSKIFACPRVVTKMFAGLMSRCTIPFACAASSASAVSIPIAINGSSSIGLPPIRCFSVVPSKNSMAINALPLVSPTSYIVQMFGWFSAEAACASLSNRASA